MIAVIVHWLVPIGLLFQIASSRPLSHLKSVTMSRFFSLKDYSRISGYGIGILTAAFGVHHYMRVQTTRLEESVYKQIETGSVPRIPHREPSNMVPREDLAKEMVYLFFPYDRQTRKRTTFGLIVGPTGTGKTALVTKECNTCPEGVLYYNVCEPKVFAHELAEAVGMKVGPSNILDLVLGYFSSDTFVYYHLPKNQEEATNMIFKTLKKASIKFQSTKGKVPTLFIDGSDVLAKFEKDLFIHVLQHAKELANDELLTIAFVSSEGSILPVVQKSSTLSRCVKMLEVTDIPDDVATDCLVKDGFSRELGTKIVDCTGGRFIYLNGCVFLHNMYTEVYPGLQDELLYEKLIKDMFLKTLNRQHCVIEGALPTSKQILKELSKKGEIAPGHFYGTSNDVENIIARLISINILRYTITGLITWHGRPQQHEFFCEERSDINQ